MIPTELIVPLLSPGGHGTQLNEIIKIVDAAVPSFQMPHIIEPRYEHVYVTSDIHADLRKFHFLLKRAELVSNNGNDDITALEIMASLETIDWIKDNTLLIIIGDLVDGKRDMREIDDTLGNIEFLLHIYLYNLRLKARARNSEIRFTIGNHDYHTIIYNNNGSNGGNKLPQFYDLYVHQTAKNYFGDRASRAHFLLPFYKCSPYFMLSVGRELAFVHGGFNNVENPGYDYAPTMSEIQEYVDVNGLDIMAKDYGNDATAKGYHDILSCVSATSPRCTTDSRFGKVTSPLWTRWYAENPSAVVCPEVVKSPYNMIIVGHCPTEFWAIHKHYIEITAQQEYQQPNNCRAGGCVLIGCSDATGPRLGFVDIGMCNSFRPFYNWDYEKTRTAEILHFSHVEGLRADRFYNKITRDGLAPFRDITPVWTAPQAGGYKNKRSRRSKSKSKRKPTKKLTRSRYSQK